MPQASTGSGREIRPPGPQKRARLPIRAAESASGRQRSIRAATPTPRPAAHRCCSPTSPRVITCGTSSCVGHSPEAMHPNTPHSSRIPNSSSSMSPPIARGRTCRRKRDLSTKQQRLPRPENPRSSSPQELPPSRRLDPRYCGGASFPQVSVISSPPFPVTLSRPSPGAPMREDRGRESAVEGRSHHWVGVELVFYQSPTGTSFSAPPARAGGGSALLRLRGGKPWGRTRWLPETKFVCGGREAVGSPAAVVLASRAVGALRYAALRGRVCEPL
nr:PREDICTED: protein IQ-DOMAIN 14-like [Equus przewalskii]